MASRIRIDTLRVEDEVLPIAIFLFYTGYIYLVILNIKKY